MGTAEVAKKCRVSESCVRKLKQRPPETGLIEALPANGGRPRTIVGNREARLKALVDMIEDVGAEVWYLPAYSPDFNTIEQIVVQGQIRAPLTRPKNPEVVEYRDRQCPYASHGIRMQKNHFVHCGYA